jgi:hypothetical protein
MSVDRALEDTPPGPARTAPPGWIGRLKARLWEALRNRSEAFQFGPEYESDPEQADLWLMLLASDPDGMWRPWPATSRRHQLDDDTGS